MVERRARHARLNEPGADGVDADIGLLELVRGCHRHRVHRRFARAVYKNNTCA